MKKKLLRPIVYIVAAIAPIAISVLMIALSINPNFIWDHCARDMSSDKTRFSPDKQFVVRSYGNFDVHQYELLKVNSCDVLYSYAGGLHWSGFLGWSSDSRYALFISENQYGEYYLSAYNTFAMSWSDVAQPPHCMAGSMSCGSSKPGFVGFYKSPDRLVYGDGTGVFLSDLKSLVKLDANYLPTPTP